MHARDLQVERWPDRTVIDFPGRPLGKFRLAGVIPIGFGLLFIGMPASSMLDFVKRMLSGSSGGFEFVFVGFLSLFVMAGLVPVGIGLFILAGRTRLTVTREKIRITEIAGPVRWSRRIRIGNVQNLEVVRRKRAAAATASVGNAAGVEDLAVLTAQMKTGKALAIVMGYPAEVLNAAAGEILTVTNTSGAQLRVEEKEKELASHEVDTRIAQRREAPSGTNVVTNFGPNGLEFSVPSRGMMKESAGFLMAGIIWTVVCSGIFSLVLFQGSRRVSWAQVAAVLPFALLFLGIGAAIILISLHLGSRAWKLKADSQGLNVSMKSWLRRKEWHWKRDELQAVKFGDSGTKVNDRSLLQLQVIDAQGRKTGLMTGRSEEELDWLAWTLSERLGLAGDDPMLKLRAGTADLRK